MKIGKEHPLIFGTLLLTAAGLASRIIGFFYRIYLSRLFGEEGMGIYQLVSPVLSLSFSLTATGYQTAISKLVAEHSAKEGRPSFRPLAAGLSISLPLSALCCFLVYRLAAPISEQLLQEPRTAPMLRILSFSIPLSAVHSCVNGYFYGAKRAGIPALSQLLEQLTRVGCVYLVSARLLAAGQMPSIRVAALGLTVGELCSMLLSILSVHCCRRSVSASPRTSAAALHCQPSAAASSSPQTAVAALHCQPSADATSLYRSLLAMALPLTANRIVLNLLQSIESVSIPSNLRLYGYDSATALSVYGVLTGMAFPLIYFPNALTSSVAILLLPMISENYALGNLSAVKTATLKTVKYSSLMGLCCMGGFVLFGRQAGVLLFDSPLAGHFIMTLGFICPFLYLDTTLSSILQGLGMAGHIFVMNALSLLVRLLFVFLAVPRLGITGYLWGVLASQLFLGILYLGCLSRFLRTKASSSIL